MSDTFCKSPFAVAVVDKDGILMPCCEYMKHLQPNMKSYSINDFDQWWSDGLGPLRQTMIQGKQDPGCSHCISKESNTGQFSLRRYTNQQIVESQETLINTPLQFPQHVELRLGSYCNLKCIMCNPYASTSIATEYYQNVDQYNKFGIIQNNIDSSQWWDNDQTQLKIIELVKHAKSVHFAGGEPLMSPKFVDILNAIDTKSQISMSTNMTKFNGSIYRALNSKNKVNVSASIDGIGGHNDYVRFGSSWNDVETAFAKLKTIPSVTLGIHYVLQHTSIFALPKVLTWANENKIPISFGEVYSGSIDGSGHMTIHSVSPADVDKFKTWLAQNPNKVIQSWVDSYKFDPLLHQHYRDYVSMLDSIRGTNFDVVFSPHWQLT